MLITNVTFNGLIQKNLQIHGGLLDSLEQQLRKNRVFVCADKKKYYVTCVKIKCNKENTGQLN